VKRDGIIYLYIFYLKLVLGYYTKVFDRPMSFE